MRQRPTVAAALASPCGRLPMSAGGKRRVFAPGVQQRWCVRVWDLRAPARASAPRASVGAVAAYHCADRGCEGAAGGRTHAAAATARGRCVPRRAAGRTPIACLCVHMSCTHMYSARAREHVLIRARAIYHVCALFTDRQQPGCPITTAGRIRSMWATMPHHAVHDMNVALKTKPHSSD